MVEMKPVYIIGMVISIYFIGALVPGAISTLFNTSTTGWSDSAIAIWGVFPLAILAYLLLRLGE